MEPGIRGYFEKQFAAEGVDPQRIQFAVIECRTSGCEIQAAGPVQDSGKPELDPQVLVRKMILGPFANDFESNNTLMTSTTVADGRIGYIAFVSRKRF